MRFLCSLCPSSLQSQSGNTMANMNPRWLAPEILRGEKATIASDIFGFGVVMWGEPW